jgi:CubicO group peptidase (beta-lactamase class C family)
MTNLLSKYLFYFYCLFSLISIAHGKTLEQQSSYKFINEYQANHDYYPGKHWLKASKPELLGWSSKKLKIAKTYAEKLNTEAIVVIDNGVIVADWGKVDKRYKVHSIRKSLLSALFGIYVTSGVINLDSTMKMLGISDIGGLSRQEQQAKVSDLLKARSGIYHSAAYETSSMKKSRPERGSHPPGTKWYYNNWDFNALFTIFEQQTGKKFFKTFKKKIADPIGMEQFRLKDTKYHLEKKSIHPAYRFRMSALDMARFGLLFLRDGKWKDKQIIPAQWVKESTEPHTPFKKVNSGYGYMWWVGHGGYYASGKGGHKIMVLPNHNIVIVHRVNTDIKGVRVKSKKFWNLMKKILSAKYNF